MKFGKAYTITNALFLVLNLAILTPTLEAMPSVPKGTILKLILNDNLSTKTSKEGDPFAAELAEDVVIPGYTMLHKGATIEGVISKMEEAKRLGGLKGKAFHGASLRQDSYARRRRAYGGLFSFRSRSSRRVQATR